MSHVIVSAAGSNSDWSSEGLLVASTFHRTLAYDISTATFPPVPSPCSGGVGAMAQLGGTAGDSDSIVLLLARYRGVELTYEILELEISARKVGAIPVRTHCIETNQASAL